MRSEETVGQLFALGFDGPEGTPETASLIRELRPGALIFFARNCKNPQQVKALTCALQETASEAGLPPLLIGIDQEGGAVQRLVHPATEWPGNMALGATSEPDLAGRAAAAVAEELLAVGINWNLAPVLDVNNNPDNPIIGIRSFGARPQEVAALGACWITAQQSAGVAACGKHFPGHGDTRDDSHVTLPRVPHDLERLKQVELVPFAAAIEAGVASIMTAHVTFPSIEPEPGLPATLSGRVITGLLRDQMQFRGVIAADALEMAAVADRFGIAEAAVRALEAGVDMLLVCSGLERQRQAAEGVKSALRSGRLKRARIEEALARIAAMKAQYARQADRDLSAVGCAAHVDLALEIARRAVTIVKNEDGLLPLKSSAGGRLLAVWFKRLPRTPVSSEERDAEALAAALSQHRAAVENVTVDIDPSSEDISAAAARARECSAAVVATLDAHVHPSQAELVKAVARECRGTVVLSCAYPADLRYFPTVKTYLACYCWRRACLEAAAAVIFGKQAARGRLPVPVE